jgi:hypothetical protein
MFEISRRLAVLGAVCIASGCASNPAPAGYLPSVSEVQSEAFGGWVDLTFRDGGSERHIAGELIAVSPDTLWIRAVSEGVLVPTRQVLGGRLISYEPGTSEVAVATVLGVVSTASNGAFLLLTAPMWMIGGSFAAGSQSRVPIQDLARSNWADLAAFSRFPQGMPSGIGLDDLRAGGR